jgi:hypothetical protein
MTVDIDPDRWRMDAACRGHDPDLFHPEKGDTVTAAKALAICARCPVADTCREHAVEHRERGIWGGTSERQRKEVRTQRFRAAGGRRTPAPCGTDAAYHRHRRAGEEPCEACLEAQRQARRVRAQRLRARVS